MGYYLCRMYNAFLAGMLFVNGISMKIDYTK